MNKIAVYGTLKEGHGNHGLLIESKKKSKEWVEIPYRMVSLGGFPGLVPDNKKNKILIETYEVNDQTLKNVDRLEGYPNFYQKDKIETSQGECEIYVLLAERYKDNKPVNEGIW